MASPNAKAATVGVQGHQQHPVKAPTHQQSGHGCETQQDLGPQVGAASEGVVLIARFAAQDSTDQQARAVMYPSLRALLADHACQTEILESVHLVFFPIGSQYEPSIYRIASILSRRKDSKSPNEFVLLTNTGDFIAVPAARLDEIRIEDFVIAFHVGRWLN